MLKKVIIKEDGYRKEYENILCVTFWDKEDVINICKNTNIDIANESDNFWNYLADWMSNCDNYPNTTEEVIDCVKEVLDWREDWDK